ncbi:hypothetical protein Dsin_011336 [Dipteronia sinensis]|uniref:EF-hand domain-containing protein n=1 Tax=Dipteronia sinensis TaxID=43782 RepID=A0AAE0AU23_9ROSI|nr:hypothetical protein Dsin_011336 [Dipteronia sinensis]
MGQREHLVLLLANMDVRKKNLEDYTEMILPIAVEDVKREIMLLQALAGHENQRVANHKQCCIAAKDFVKKFLVKDPRARLTAAQALLQALAKDLPRKLKESRFLEILQAIDSNTDGLVDFSEFIVATLHVHQLEEHDSDKWYQRSRAAFDKFDIDKDRDGFS